MDRIHRGRMRSAEARRRRGRHRDRLVQVPASFVASWQGAILSELRARGVVR
jgi:hypothetical protein